jgi:hypothetical protein
VNTIAVMVAALAAGAAPDEQPPTEDPAIEAEQPDAEAPDAEAPDAEASDAETSDAEAPEDVADETAEAEDTEPEAAEAPEPETPAESGEVFQVAQGSGHDGPPYYSEEEAGKLRKRHGLEAHPPEGRAPARWRCLIADPTCGINFELNATAAYAYRGRQGDTRRQGQDPRWHSGRAQYDFWVNFPVMLETRGKARYTRMTLGPKGGVIFSDTGSLWGNFGLAVRYWFGRGRWAPALEFTSALSYKLGSRPTQDLGGADPKFRMTRGPVGFTADVGFGLGGFGAIVVGGQYDSPLAREEVPEQFRVSAAGMFFVGFRGNILWGGPAAAAILTHGLTQRYAQEP